MKPLIILLPIIIFGLFLRIHRLDSRPLGFTWDEAALGYNAYSILKTGRDEHSQVMPIVFKSFGDYKPGLYIYFTTPIIKVLGLTEFATRLPSAIFGTLLIPVIYLLVKIQKGKAFSLSSALMIAINPWAIHFSRGAWEANLSLLLTSLAVLLFLKKKNYSSSLFFGLTFWAYQGAKLFTPLLIISLLFIYRPILKNLIKPFLVILFILLPILLKIGTESGRLKVFSVFGYTRPDAVVSEIMRQDNSPTKNLSYYLFHSELLDQGRGIAQRYLNHFSSQFLFINGDWSNPRHSTPYYGYLHLPEVITLFIGIILLLKSQSPLSRLILAWLLLAPLPSALSRDIVSGVRSLPMIIPLIIISGLGLSKILSKKLLIFLYFPVLLFFLLYLLDLYFVHYPHYFASDWLSPYKPALKLAADNYSRYQKIIFTSQYGQPYIFTLFYLRIDPKIYQSQNKFQANPQRDVGSVSRLDRFEFRPIYWPSDRGLTSTLFIGGQYELPEKDLNIPGIEGFADINFPNGQIALRAVGLR